MGKTTRKSLSPKIRFEVFQRDSFTCQYCGRKTPAVILEVDHIIPVKKGGGDDFENLRTSCWECNHGKGGTPLSATTGPDDPYLASVEIAEREMQIKAYNEILAKRLARENKEIECVRENWGRLCPNAWTAPSSASLRPWLRKLAEVEILEAVEIVSEAMSRPGPKRVDYSGALSYFYAVLRNKAEPRAE